MSLRLCNALLGHYRHFRLSFFLQPCFFGPSSAAVTSWRLLLVSVLTLL